MNWKSRLRAEAETAALMARQRMLSQKHALEEQQELLRKRKEELDLDMELAASMAKVSVLKAAEGSCVSNVSVKSDGMNSYLERGKGTQLRPDTAQFVPEFNTQPAESGGEALLSGYSAVRPKTHNRMEPPAAVTGAGPSALLSQPAAATGEEDSPTQDLTVNFGNSLLTPTLSARNLGVTIDSQLSLTPNITATTRSCRYTLYNIRRIRPLLTQKAAQVLIQALVISRLDYCNSLLADLPATAIRPLQLIQNAAARLVINLPKFSHTTPLLRSLHWLPVAARIQFKTLVLTYHAVNGSGPAYIQDMVKPYIPTRTLRSAPAKLLVPPSLRAKHSTRSQLFAVLAPKWWNELSEDTRTAESLHIFRRKLKTHLFRLYLD
uniref:Uncharacterized protein n=1 Tax=Gasterosteus aculeatus aculeatus TaxID=481459 RepID=A0AAQ4REA4_GASAC